MIASSFHLSGATDARRLVDSIDSHEPARRAGRAAYRSSVSSYIAASSGSAELAGIQFSRPMMRQAAHFAFDLSMITPKLWSNPNRPLARMMFGRPLTTTVFPSTSVGGIQS